MISPVIIFLAIPGMILGLIHSLFLYNRVFFGPVPPTISYYFDRTMREFFILALFVLFILTLGLAPTIIYN